MNQNSVFPSQIEAPIPPTVLQQNGGMSMFYIEQNAASLERMEQNLRRLSFKTFIDSRTKYLTGLNRLGNNWISGSSKQPTEESIKMSTNILREIEEWYTLEGYKAQVYPKITMGPTPAGGIGMEIELFPSMSAYVSISNKDITYETESNGHFVEEQVGGEDVSNKILNLYYSSNEGRSNPQRAVPLQVY
jgi:hypothetical protein